ncbi:flagellar hook-length control protein FliK [Tateyamaria omphalii]|uniref:flagellar hook-length control protein FliK n=1 Tax=Tateyamaria omphalii TaxID=299262 RepID=UPI001C98E70F|nr:flagellar hook-length control protein FliK [Tateyamaria omphalii]MBY5933611.1 flagellar hook-length control protein FliK [Tateyamaria omphalii]
MAAVYTSRSNAANVDAERKPATHHGSAREAMGSSETVTNPTDEGAINPSAAESTLPSEKPVEPTTQPRAVKKATPISALVQGLSAARQPEAQDHVDQAIQHQVSSQSARQNGVQYQGAGSPDGAGTGFVDGARQTNSAQTANTSAPAHSQSFTPTGSAEGADGTARINSSNGQAPRIEALLVPSHGSSTRSKSEAIQSNTSIAAAATEQNAILPGTKNWKSSSTSSAGHSIQFGQATVGGASASETHAPPTKALYANGSQTSLQGPELSQFATAQIVKRARQSHSPAEPGPRVDTAGVPHEPTALGPAKAVVVSKVQTASVPQASFQLEAKNVVQFSSAPIDLLQPASDLVWDVRPSVVTGNTLSSAQLHRAELPPAIQHMIAEAFRKAPDRPIELALNPAELGRVRMVMSTHEAGVTVTITADRGDTLDLMRRNIDDLGKSLNDLGFGDVSFAFEGGQNSSDGSTVPETDDAQTDVPGAERHAETQHNNAPKSIARLGITPGIDMRF